MKDHPRASELVALAKDRAPSSRAKLAALLDELDLPRDTFMPAGGEIVLPRKDQVLVGDTACPYEITENLMEIRGAVPFAGNLIAHAERLGGWTDSTQVTSSGESYQDAARSSMGQKITEGAFTGLYTRLRDTLWECARFYQCWNKHLVVGSGGDWEILRYREGGCFDVHVDAIANTKWTRRQLSCLLYLNDDFVGGETRFCAPGPEITVKPETGKAALFPPFFTHPHEGLPVISGTKYIVLGWFYP